jgi:hypothetical protein
MTFLDTGIMVGAVLKSHPEHAACLAALEDSVRPFTNAHAIAETFATLTGFYKVPTDAATELTLSLRDSVEVEALAWRTTKRRFGRRAAGGSWAGEFTIPACDVCPPQKSGPDRDAQPVTLSACGAGH